MASGRRGAGMHGILRTESGWGNAKLCCAPLAVRDLGNQPHACCQTCRIACPLLAHPPAYLCCRESMLKLEVVEEGLLNAVVFWFDLHLDDYETLTNGEQG